jgi:hypothetical protein
MRFSEQMLEKVLAGEKTVTRRPVKFNRSGKHLPARYKVNGGPGGAYALQEPPEEDSNARARTVPGYRLRVVAVDGPLLELGDVTDAEARLEGFVDRISFLGYWQQLYGELNFKQKVWRYEFELVGEGRSG